MKFPVSNPFSKCLFESGSDPGAPDTAAAKGSISLSFGKLLEKVSCVLLGLVIRVPRLKL